MQKSRSSKSIRNATFGYIQQIITLVLAFVSRTIFVQLLGTEYLGISVLFTNILTLLSLAELGIGNVLTYNLYGALQSDNKEKIIQLISFYKKLYRIIAITITIIGIIIMPFLKYIVNSPLPQKEIIISYILYLINSVVSYFVVFKITLLRADQNEYIKNIVSTIALILQYVFQIIYICIYKDFYGFLIIQVIFTLLQNICCNFITNKKYPYIKEVTTNTSYIDMKSLSTDIKSMFTYKLSNVIVTSTDNILISIFVGTNKVGIYSNYSMLINYIANFINITINSIIASLGNLNANRNDDSSYKMHKNLMYVFGTISIYFCACVINVLQEFIVIWIGEKYLLSNWTVFWILITFYITHAYDPNWMFCETMGLFKERKNSMIINALLNILLSIILSKPFGITGIIAATSIARVLTIVWWEPYILYKYKFKRPLKEYMNQQITILCKNIIIIFTSLFICRYIFNGFSGIIFKILACTIIVIGYEYIFMRNSDEYIWVKNKISLIFINKLKGYDYSRNEEY